MQELSDGRQQIEIQGSTVRDVINNLEECCPGFKNKLMDGFKLKSNINVAVDGEVSPVGVLAKVQENSEVHFLPALGGG